MSKQDAESSSDTSRTPFERFEDMARRIVSVPRKEVPPVKRTPRTPNANPRASPRKPKRA